MAKQPKVFCIGFMKTGTTTLNEALRMLGYRVSHKSWLLLNPIMQGDWQAVKEHANAWDALEDNPIPLIYKELDELFPGSKFILSIRDSEAWYKSVSHHIGNLPSPMHEWVFGQGKSLPKDDKAHTLAVFNQHQEAVKAYFNDRPDQLLVMDITKTNDWTEFCAFLDTDAPKESFPHKNKGRYKEGKHATTGEKLKYWKKRVINPLKISLHQRLNHFPTPTERLENL